MSIENVSRDSFGKSLSPDTLMPVRRSFGLFLAFLIPNNLRPRGMYHNPSYVLVADSSWYRPLAFLSPHLPVYNDMSVITFCKLFARPHFAEYDLCAGHTFLGRDAGPDVLPFVGSSVYQ